MEKVTRSDLRNMAAGETRVFELPNGRACDNAKSVAYQLQNVDGCKYSVDTDYTNSKISITKSEL